MFLADYLTQDVYYYKNGDGDAGWDPISVFRGVREGEMVRLCFPKREPLRAEIEAFLGAVSMAVSPRSAARTV